MMTGNKPPWQAHFPDVADWDAPLEIMTVPEMLALGVAAGGDKSAIDFRHAKISYRQLADDVERLASGLAQAGVGRGDPVALLLPNTPYHPIAFFAITRLGARVVHISPLDARREIEHKLKASGARWLVTTNLPDILPKALDQLDTGLVDHVLVGDDERWGAGQVLPLPLAPRPGVRDLAELFSDAPLVALMPDVDDIALLQFTGGTTGLPKVAMLSHGNLAASVSIYRLCRDVGDPAPGAEKVVAVLPLFHIFALTTILLRHVREGNELLLRQRFDAGELIRDIEVERATLLSGVPTMWVALINRPGVDQVDFSSLKACISGGAPLPLEVQTRVERLLGNNLINGWGMTETSPAGTRLPTTAERRAGVIGVPLSAIDMRVVRMDDPSREAPIGEVGEIAIRGPNVFKGYFGDEQATKDAFRDGWFLTGDMGRMDERGLFELVDRRKNMIISSGFNVYPAAVENAIYEHPSVKEVIVIGIPDSYRGQSAKAYITLREGAEPFALEELTAFLADRLGRHEMPRALEFRGALPRSPVGKLLPLKLKAEVEAELEAASRAAATSPSKH